MHVLVIEDDAMVARVVARALEQADYQVDVAHNVGDGTRSALQNAYDAILLDLELPDGDGLNVVRALRGTGAKTPILIMTGRGDDEHVVKGLDEGADDYLLKPVGAEVLKARMRAVLRRATPAPAPEPTLVLGDLTIDRLGRVVTGKGTPISLTPKEFSMLEFLMLNAEKVVTRAALLSQVWNMNFDPGSNVVDAHVARLRQKLRGIITMPEIRTVRGVGFMLSNKSGDDDASER